VLQVLYLSDSAGGGDVAYLAHIGGFVAGAALIKPFLIGRNDPPPRTPAIGPVY
jgi:membrane associated rhomboid family serine protease